MRKRTLFKPSDVETAYVSDMPCFQSLVNFVASQKTKVLDVSPARIEFAFRINKLYWRAKDYNLFRDRPSGKISCAQIFHEGTHSLVVNQYGTALHGRPMFTLYSEALAAGTNFYYFLNAIKMGTLGEHGNANLGIYAKNCEMLYEERSAPGEAALQVIKESIADPFVAYRGVVRDIFAVHRIVWSINDARVDEKPFDLEATYLKIRALKFAPVIFHYDFPGHFHFALNFCGPDSTEEDREALEQVSSLLMRCRSMLDFYEALAAKPLRLKRAA